VLELGEVLLDRVRSGEYLGRKKSLAPTERMAPRTCGPCGAEIVHDDDVAGTEGGKKNLVDVDGGRSRR